MASLESVIYDVFMDNGCNARTIYYSSDRYEGPSSVIKYMEIPIDGPSFELPVFAWHAFSDIPGLGAGISSLIAQLYSYEIKSRYQSPSAIFKDAISQKFSAGLVQVTSPDHPNKYYMTRGAVFDTNFTPIFMLSYLIDRVGETDSIAEYAFRRPVLRIDPRVYAEKEDAVQKLLAGKVINETLALRCVPPSYNSLYYKDSLFEMSVKVEIDKCPFTVKDTDTPSISVTNNTLLELAANHIEDVFI